MRSPPGRDEQRTVPSSTGVCRDTPSQAGGRREDLKLLIDLFEENERLHRQVGEMESFLKDHGLVWIGAGDRVGDGKFEHCALPHENYTGTVCSCSSCGRRLDLGYSSMHEPCS